MLLISYQRKVDISEPERQRGGCSSLALGLGQSIKFSRQVCRFLFIGEAAYLKIGGRAKMVKTRQAGQTRGARRWVSLLAWSSFGLGMTLAAGCSSTPVTSGPPPDPLFGVLVPPGMPQPTNTPKASDSSMPTTPQASNQGGVPATPASLSSSNTATLAGASWQGPLGRPLKMDDNNSSGPPFLPGQLTGRSKTQQVPGVLGPNPNPKVEQVPDIAPAVQPVTPTSSWQTPQMTQPAVQTANAVQPPSTEALSKQLQDRGVINQKQDVAPEGVRLTCYVSRGPGAGLRILEVTAADYASAAQAILKQLDATR
jgi:hypothetical protein